jgi:hypothetical protein
MYISYNTEHDPNYRVKNLDAIISYLAFHWKIMGEGQIARDLNEIISGLFH